MTIRIGVNAHDPVLYFLSTLGILERDLEPHGEDVAWVPYAPGPKAPEFLGEQLDFVGCGQTPMLKAHQDGLPVVYIASSASRPNQGALLVAADPAVSGVRRPADLVGREVAVGLGGWPTQLLAVALDNDGVSFADIEVVEPQGDDDLRRLLDGEVAAIAALGPRLVLAEETGRVRRLVPTDSAISNRHLFTATRSFVQERPDVLATILTAMEKANHWVSADFARAGRQRAEEQRYGAPDWGGDARSWEAILRRMPWGVVPIDAAFVAEQQHAGEVLSRAGYLERAGDARAAFVPELITLVNEAVHAAG